MVESLTEKCEKKYNETLDLFSSSGNNIIFCVFNNKYVYGYLCLFLSLFKK